MPTRRSHVAYVPWSRTEQETHRVSPPGTRARSPGTRCPTRDRGQRPPWAGRALAGGLWAPGGHGANAVPGLGDGLGQGDVAQGSP